MNWEWLGLPGKPGRRQPLRQNTATVTRILQLSEVFFLRVLFHIAFLHYRCPFADALPLSWDLIRRSELSQSNIDRRVRVFMG